MNKQVSDIDITKRKGLDKRKRLDAGVIRITMELHYSSMESRSVKVSPRKTKICLSSNEFMIFNWFRALNTQISIFGSMLKYLAMQAIRSSNPKVSKVVTFGIFFFTKWLLFISSSSSLGSTHSLTWSITKRAPC